MHFYLCLWQVFPGKKCNKAGNVSLLPQWTKTLVDLNGLDAQIMYSQSMQYG